MGVRTTIALHKTLEQLLTEKFKPGNVYTCDANANLQIYSIIKEHGKWYIHYLLKFLNDGTIQKKSLDLENFIDFFDKDPVSRYMRSEKLWHPV